MTFFVNCGVMFCVEYDYQMSLNQNACYNLIGDGILDRCFSIGDGVFIRNLSTSAFSVLSPYFLVSVFTVSIFLQPLLFTHVSKHLYDRMSELYTSLRLKLISFFHRVTYCYTLFTMLRYLMDEPVPCLCEKNHIPQRYNSPNHYTYVCTTVGLIIIEQTSYHLAGIIVGVLVIIAPSVLYILGGYLSLGQFFFTFSLSALLHFYSKYTSNFLMLIEDVILFIVNLGFLIYLRSKDYDEEIFNASSSNSIEEVFWRGFSHSVYDLFLVSCFLWNNHGAYLTVSQRKVFEEESSALSSTLLSDDEGATQYAKTMEFDKKVGLVGLMLFYVLKCIEYGVIHYIDEEE